MSELTRRDFLKVTAVGVAAASEGCADSAGPAASAENPPTGAGGTAGALPLDAGKPPKPPADAAATAADTGSDVPAVDASAPGPDAAAVADTSPPSPDTATVADASPPSPDTVAPIDAAVMDPMPPEAIGPGGMPLRALGKTGLMVSIVGFGTGSQYVTASEAEAERLVHRAVELGVTYFDTAVSYGGGSAQVRLGKYLVPTHRSQVLLVSKTYQRTAEGAKRELDTALTSMGTDHLDIFHFHDLIAGDTDAILAKGGAYEVFQKAKEQGVIRFIGLTGHTSAAILLDALARIKPDVVMCPQNAAHELGFTDLVLPYGRDHGIGLLGMKVTAQDALIRNGVTPEELIRYSLSLPVSGMIIGMRSIPVLESCAAIAKAFVRMTPVQMMQVSSKLASLDLPRCLPYRRPFYIDGACRA